MPLRVGYCSSFEGRSMVCDLPFADTAGLQRLWRYLRTRGGPSLLLTRVTAELLGRGVL